MPVKLPPEVALAHPRRAEIVRQVTASPGIHLAELARRLGCRISPIGHHVIVLERAGLLREAREGQNRKFWAVTE